MVEINILTTIHQVMLWSIAVNTHAHTCTNSLILVLSVNLIIHWAADACVRVEAELPATIDLSGKDISCNDAI